MTVAQVFASAGLTPSGPVHWKQPIVEPNEGVYVIARGGNANLDYTPCELPLRNPLPAYIQIDSDYESQRWLPNEPVVYIGKTDRRLERRIAQFYAHHCGDRSPHAGGQILLLLTCDLWVYWSRSDHPQNDESTMLYAFEKTVGKAPFANFDRKRGLKRVRRLIDQREIRTFKSSG